MLYQSLTIDTYRLIWEDYEEKPRLLEYISSGEAYSTLQNSWSSEAVWLFQQSQLHLSGPELDHFRYAVLRGVLVNFIWDTNVEGLHWLKKTLHTPAGAHLLQALNNGECGLLGSIFKDLRLIQPWDIGEAIISALLLLGIDIGACIRRELLQFPLSVAESYYGFRLRKRITFAKQIISGHTLDWAWIYDQSAPGYLLTSELAAFTVNSDMQLSYDNNIFLGYRGQGNGPLWMNRHDRAKIYDEIDRKGGGKWPPRFERRRAKRERKERARSGQKPTRTKMPGSWIP
jgi:hypothetical protein